MIRDSALYIRGFRKGYWLAARHAGWRPGLLLGTALLIGVLSVGVSLGFLWASADLFLRWSSGTSISKVVVSKGQAWRRSLEWEP